MNFETHRQHIEAGVAFMEIGRYDLALEEFDVSLEYGNTPHAHWDRALTLFSLGRYREAKSSFDRRWDLFGHGVDARATQLRRDLPAWRGQELIGRRLVVIHEAGFGDTIMLLRFLPHLRVKLALHMPSELHRLTNQYAPLLDAENERDFACTTFDLLTLLPRPEWDGAYVKVSMFDRDQFRDYRGMTGIAWSSQRGSPPAKSMELKQFLDALPRGFGNLVSLQAHDHDAAQAHGVHVPPVTDFADLAALISQLDRVISIDTAALNMAGAVNHPNVWAMLPHVPSWRWQNGPWYPRVNLCCQDSAGDWESAFAKIR